MQASSNTEDITSYPYHPCTCAQLSRWQAWELSIGSELACRDGKSSYPSIWLRCAFWSKSLHGFEPDTRQTQPSWAIWECSTIKSKLAGTFLGSVAAGRHTALAFKHKRRRFVSVPLQVSFVVFFWSPLKYRRAITNIQSSSPVPLLYWIHVLKFSLTSPKDCTALFSDHHATSQHCISVFYIYTFLNPEIYRPHSIGLFLARLFDYYWDKKGYF